MLLTMEQVVAYLTMVTFGSRWKDKIRRGKKLKNRYFISLGGRILSRP